MRVSGLSPLAEREASAIFVRETVVKDPEIATLLKRMRDVARMLAAATATMAASMAVGRRRSTALRKAWRSKVSTLAAIWKVAMSEIMMDFGSSEILDASA